MSHFRVKGIPVLIASTLKPIRDPRAYEKLALSLGETNKYNLNIIGFSSKKAKSTSQIRFFSSMSVFHSIWDRILAQGRFVKCLFQVRPKILICCTYEYLMLATWCKRILGYKLIYDVQENYIANLDLNPNLTQGQKIKRKSVIQKAESVSGIDLFLFAERCYIQEMPEKKPFLVLENKFQGEIHSTNPKDFHGKTKFKFVISGTLTPAYGVMEGIQWFSNIREVFPESELLVLGHVPLKDFRNQLEEIQKQVPGIHLLMSTEPIPHEEIIVAIQNSDFALAPYHLHPAIKDKYPTKLFECAALGTPILITPNPIWKDFLKAFSGGFEIDFSDLNQAVPTFQQALSQTYFSTPVTEDVLWKSEKLHFQEAIQNLLH